MPFVAPHHATSIRRVWPPTRFSDAYVFSRVKTRGGDAATTMPRYLTGAMMALALIALPLADAKLMVRTDAPCT
jgi:hypothetical protein